VPAQTIVNGGSTITAEWTGVTRTTTLTVAPGAPAAILSVYLTANNAFMFELTNNGGGRYSDQRGMIFDPIQITVRSNLGGAATALTATDDRQAACQLSGISDSRAVACTAVTTVGSARTS
jgi:hypothetical protein